MRVIDNHQKWLAHGDRLKSAGNILEIADTVRDDFIGQAKRLCRSNGGENVVHVDAPHQRRLNIDFAVGRQRRKRKPGKTQLKFLGGKPRAGIQAIGDHIFRRASQSFSVLVIDVEHRHIRRARSGAFKKPQLGREIILKRFMIIHVLAREIGENSRGEVATPQTIHRQGM